MLTFSTCTGVIVLLYLAFGQVTGCLTLTRRQVSKLDERANVHKAAQAVCSNITYKRTGEGWLYLCTVKDAVTGEILGESMSESLKKELVIKAFLNAQARYSFTKGMIFHSDRGSQYTSKEFMRILAQFGIRQGFSQVRMCPDYEHVSV